MQSENSLQQDTEKLPQTPTSPADFHYQPLRDGEEFRLLSLCPGSGQDPIRCAIFHASTQLEIEYEAVSYTWATEDGDDRLSQTILCSYVGELESTTLLATVNCAAALRRLRDENYERTLWIDAVCIDKSNDQERSQQVKFMTEIYSNASQVLVYLGEEDLGFSSHNLWFDQSRRRTALEKLFAKRWASRVWVIQEVALAQRVILITGDATCQMDTDLLTRIKGRARAYGMAVPCPLALVATRDLLTLLHESRNCFTTDPRDKVYGLMGFAGERLRDLIKVDYSASVDEVLTNAAAAIIISREDLDILTYASASLGPRHRDSRLPTWVPDWITSPIPTRPLLRPLFQSDEIGPWRSLNKLSSVYPRPQYLEELDWNTVVQIPPDWTENLDSKPFLIVRAHCIGTIDNRSQIPRANSLTWQSTQSFSQLLKGLVENNLPESSWPQEVQSILRHSSWDDHSIDRPDLISFCKELDPLGENKYMFRAGHLPGAADAGFREGDSVWAIDGCRIPLILRALEGDDQFKIVGNCRLFGLRRLDCWAISGSGNKTQWHFDPFRQLNVRDTRMIDIF